MADPTADQRAWVDQWRRAGAELAIARREELRRLTDSEALALSESLLELAPYAWRADRNAAGLVEQQRIFARSRQ